MQIISDQCYYSLSRKSKNMANLESGNDLCRCCHSEGSYESLYASYFWLDVEEVVYFNMLQECFDIEMSPVSEPLQHMLSAICNSCIERLQDAVKFKRQIQKCERRFREVYGSCVGEELGPYEVKIKQEIREGAKEGKINVHYDKDVMMRGSPDTIMADVCNSPNTIMADVCNSPNDNDGWSERDDDLFTQPVERKFNPKTKVKRKPTVRESSKNKSRRGVKRKASVTDSTTDAAEDNQPSGDQEDSEKAEQIEVIDGVTFYRIKNQVLRRNIDFKMTEDGSMQCNECTEIAMNERAIKRHINRVHHKKYKYKCPHCIKLFWALSTLVLHKFKEHNIDEKVRCDACGIAFPSKRRLNFHRDTFHMLGKKFTCDMCDFETYNRIYLLKHKVNHTTEKKFQCQFCKKCFKRKTTLSFHERIHTGDKRKVCSECGQAFVQRASLKYHMHKQHPGVDF